MTATDKDTEDAAEVAVSALEVYATRLASSKATRHLSRESILKAAAYLVAADTIAAAILEANQ